MAGASGDLAHTRAPSFPGTSSPLAAALVSVEEAAARQGQALMAGPFASAEAWRISLMCSPVRENGSVDALERALDDGLEGPVVDVVGVVVAGVDVIELKADRLGLVLRPVERRVVLEVRLGLEFDPTTCIALRTSNTSRRGVLSTEDRKRMRRR